MPDAMNDLFMYMTDESGNDMKGESSLQIAKRSSLETMMQDFKSADYVNYSNFFDVTEFDFNIEMDDSDQSGKSDSLGAHGDWYIHKDPLKKFADQKNQHKLKKITGTFGKLVDSVSPIFFQNCCNKSPFKKAVLVKRAFTGLPVAIGDSSGLGYLQILMTDVRITSVSWTDGELLEEKIRFKCEHMEIYYRTQSNDGNLIGKVPLMNWTWSKGTNTQ
jgi:type VI protein secretion system component Hcp